MTREKKKYEKMNSRSHIIHSHVRENPRAFKIQERKKIADDLRAKCANEFRHASRWKKFLIGLKIQREAARIYRHRLYSICLNSVIR